MLVLASDQDGHGVERRARRRDKKELANFSHVAATLEERRKKEKTKLKTKAPIHEEYASQAGHLI